MMNYWKPYEKDKKREREKNMDFLGWKLDSPFKKW